MQILAVGAFCKEASAVGWSPLERMRAAVEVAGDEAHAPRAARRDVLLLLLIRTLAHIRLAVEGWWGDDSAASLEAFAMSPAAAAGFQSPPPAGADTSSSASASASAAAAAASDGGLSTPTSGDPAGRARHPLARSRGSTLSPGHIAHLRSNLMMIGCVVNDELHALQGASGVAHGGHVLVTELKKIVLWAFQASAPPLPRSPGTVPPWMEDDRAPVCLGCGKEWRTNLRRHHCRLCGGVFCAECSAGAMLVPDTQQRSAGAAGPPPAPLRVCGPCEGHLAPIQSALKTGMSVPGAVRAAAAYEALVSLTNAISGSLNRPETDCGSLQENCTALLTWLSRAGLLAVVSPQEAGASGEAGVTPFSPFAGPAGGGGGEGAAEDGGKAAKAALMRWVLLQLFNMLGDFLVVRDAMGAGARHGA